MTDNEQIQKIHEWTEDGNDSSLMNKDGVRFLLQQIKQRDKTISELHDDLNEVSVAFDNQSFTLWCANEENQAMLSALEQMLTCVNAFMKDCKKYRMNIPYDMYHGAYADLKNAYVQTSNVITKVKSDIKPIQEANNELA